MELTIAKLHLADAKTPIPDYGQGPDPYQALQIHDYLSVSFLRQPAEVKAASSKTIQLFQLVYPETMSKKFFVNVPLVSATLRMAQRRARVFAEHLVLTEAAAVYAVDVWRHGVVHGKGDNGQDAVDELWD